MTGLFLSLALSLALQGPAPAAPQAPTQPAPARLNGVWEINKDLSTKPMAPPAEGGGSSREGGGGGRPGGGGMGGRGGPRRGGDDGGRGDVENQRKAMAIMQELGQAPARLIFTSKPDAVSTTDIEGVVRKFVVDGKTEKVAINGHTIEVKSKWSGDVLSQEFKAGSAKFQRDIETTTDGRQLVITVTPKEGGGGLSGPAFLRFVYDRSRVQ